MSTRERGFTLIEVMVVIAIIGALSAVVVSTISGSHAKSNDARRISDMRAIGLDLQLYQERFGTVPINNTPCCGYPDSSPNFLQELVDKGYLPANPKAPDKDTTNPYYYYNYSGGVPGYAGPVMVLKTELEAAAPTATGYANTCRPWPAGQNWCDQSSNNQYCLCIPY